MTEERDQREAWAVEVWNACCPSGTPVTVTLDDGSTEHTATRSRAWRLGDGTAWRLGDGTPVVSVEGRAGGYLLWRICPAAGGVRRREVAPEPAEQPSCTCPDAVPCPVHDDEIGTGEVELDGTHAEKDDCPF